METTPVRAMDSSPETKATGCSTSWIGPMDRFIQGTEIKFISLHLRHCRSCYVFLRHPMSKTCSLCMKQPQTHYKHQLHLLLLYLLRHLQLQLLLHHSLELQHQLQAIPPTTLHHKPKALILLRYTYVEVKGFGDGLLGLMTSSKREVL